MYSSEDQLTEEEEYKKFWKIPPPAIYRQAPPTTGIPANGYSNSTDQYSSTDYTTTTITTTTNTATSKSSSQAPSEDKPKPKVPWSTGLCDCFSDVNNCCLTCWCPCITFGKIAEIVDKGSASCGASGALYALIGCVTACACCYSCFYRAKIRQQYSLHEKPCADCCVHCFCECCALCQEYRELQIQGYDMAVGWHGNVERQHREAEMAEMAPIVEDGMSRSMKY